MPFFPILRSLLIACLFFAMGSEALYATALSNPIATPSQVLPKPAPSINKASVPVAEPNSAVKTNASTAKAAPVVAGQVVWVKGSVQAVSPDKKVRELKRRDLVYEHDTITTKDGGTGQLVFSDNTLVSLDENTSFKIDQYRFNQHTKPEQERYIVNVIKGGFRTVTGQISKAGPDHYKINTPVATIGVRGTEIVGHINENGEGAFSVPEGAADFTNASGTFTLDKTKPHANFSSYKTPANYTAQPSPSLKSIPALEKVQASPDLIQQSATTSASAPPPGSPDSGGTGSSGSGDTGESGSSDTDSSTTTTSTGSDSSSTGDSSSSSGDSSSSSSSESGDTGTGESSGGSSGVVGSFCVM